MVNIGALTVGVEEEFLLVDAATRVTSPRAGAVLARLARVPLPAEGMSFQAELAATQLEAATGVCLDLTSLRGQLWDGRACLAAAAEAEGLRLVSTGNPVLTEHPVPFMPGDHYARVTEILAGAVSGYESCGCHVHVGLADRELAVGVLNHLRPWLPTLLALSVNSPFDRGRDSGYASWRIQAQARFPGAGVPPWFPSAAAYDRRLHRLVELGALADTGTTYWLARPSQWLPTIEIRAADAASTVDEAVLQAAMVRALVLTALTDLAEGREALPIDDQLCAAALWSAARYGLSGPGIHPVKELRLDATVLVEELLRHVRPALEETGDLAMVRRSIRRLGPHGTGAVRQREAAVHGLPNVVDMLVRQTGRR
jgi:glutamate---cysteine ligase / carboxylate-amine ligase